MSAEPRVLLNGNTPRSFQIDICRGSPAISIKVQQGKGRVRLFNLMRSDQSESSIDILKKGTR
jgi:hypothetical protein